MNRCGVPRVLLRIPGQISNGTIVVLVGCLQVVYRCDRRGILKPFADDATALMALGLARAA